MATSAFSNTFEKAWEQGVHSVKQAISDQVNKTTQAAASQLGVTVRSDSSHPTQVDASKALTDQFNETGPRQQHQQNPQQSDAATQQAMQALEAKDLEERQKKLAETRQRLQQLHKQTYYDPTFHRRQQEPTVQEKLEQEKQEEEQKKMEKLEKEKEKEVPIALKKAQTKTEMYRGVSG